MIKRRGPEGEGVLPTHYPLIGTEERNPGRKKRPPPCPALSFSMKVRKKKERGLKGKGRK